MRAFFSVTRRVLVHAITGSTMLLVGISYASAQTAELDVPGPSFVDVLSLEYLGGYDLSPDGTAVAYEVRSPNWEENRYDREIWLWRQGREAIRLTRSPNGTSRSPRWSPDGRWIAFLSDRDEEQQIQLIRSDGGEAMALTSHEEGVNSFDWSPDGTRIAFTASDPADSLKKKLEEEYGAWAVEDDDTGRTHLWVVDVVGDSASEPARLTEGMQFTVNGFEWSPDGEWLLFSSAGADTTSDYYLNSRLWKISSTGGGDPIPLAAELDENLWSYWWTKSGIYVVAWQGTSRRVFKVDPESGGHTEFAAHPAQIWGLDFSADESLVLVNASSATTLRELYLTDASSYAPVKITDFSAQLAGWNVGTSEVVSWRSEDGTEIEGVLHKPTDFDSSRKYPLLVVIHGGPTGTDYPMPVLGYVYPVNQWLAKGALVLRPNYRGSAGYGEAFRSLNVRNLGVGDAWDVLSGVDYLVEQGIVDEDRMGAMGWSQGGYISAFLTTTTDRFAAISVGAGISNWMTYYVNTDIHPFTRQYLKGTPWDDPEVYAKTSPMTYILDATTPTLIQHGENDQRVPIPNAYELYQGLQDVGVETKLIVYEDFGHGISRPKERLAAVWHNWQWFGKYIWDEDVQLPLPEPEEDGEDGSEGGES